MLDPLQRVRPLSKTVASFPSVEMKSIVEHNSAAPGKIRGPQPSSTLLRWKPVIACTSESTQPALTHALSPRVNEGPHRPIGHPANPNGCRNRSFGLDPVNQNGIADLYVAPVRTDNSFLVDAAMFDPIHQSPDRGPRPPDGANRRIRRRSPAREAAPQTSAVRSSNPPCHPPTITIDASVGSLLLFRYANPFDMGSSIC